MFTACRDLLTRTHQLSQISVAILDTPTRVTERGRGVITGTALGPGSGNIAMYRCVVSDVSITVSSFHDILNYIQGAAKSSTLSYFANF